MDGRSSPCSPTVTRGTLRRWRIWKDAIFQSDWVTFQFSAVVGVVYSRRSGRNTEKRKEKEEYTQSGCHIIAASSSHYGALHAWVPECSRTSHRFLIRQEPRSQEDSQALTSATRPNPITQTLLIPQTKVYDRDSELPPFSLGSIKKQQSFQRKRSSQAITNLTRKSAEKACKCIWSNYAFILIYRGNFPFDLPFWEMRYE